MSDRIIAWMNAAEVWIAGPALAGAARAPLRLLAWAAFIGVFMLLNLVAIVRWPLTWALGQVRRRPPRSVGDPLSCDTPGLATLIADHNVVFVDFFAHWCGPCVLTEPAVRRLAATRADTPSFAVAKVDTTRHPGLAKRYRVEGLPTFLLLVDGREVARYAGAMTYLEMLRLVDGVRPDSDEAPVCDLKTGICSSGPG